jgi:hypothetical protein
MLVMRKEQMDVFGNYEIKKFEDRMVLHLRSSLPEEAETITEEVLRQMIQTGIDKAESYQVTDEVDVERFLECMVRYGSDFDTDPKTSWAGEILRDEGFTGTEKMNQINDYELFVLTEDRS